MHERSTRVSRLAIIDLKQNKAPPLTEDALFASGEHSPDRRTQMLAASASEGGGPSGEIDGRVARRQVWLTKLSPAYAPATRSPLLSSRGVYNRRQVSLGGSVQRPHTS
jgi:hypothetical protein